METNLDDKAAAKSLGMAVQTLRNWRCQRKGPPYIRLGRSIRYQVKDIEAYKQKKRVDPENSL